MYKFENYVEDENGVIKGRIVPKWESQRLLIFLMSIIVSFAIALIAVLYFVPNLWNGGWIDTLVLFAGVVTVVIMTNQQFIESSKKYTSISKFNPYHYETFEELVSQWGVKKHIDWIVNTWYATEKIERKIFAIYHWIIRGLVLGIPLGLLYLGLIYSINIVLNWIFNLLIMITDGLLWLISLLITLLTSGDLIIITFVFIIGTLMLGVGYYICSGIVHRNNNKLKKETLFLILVLTLIILGAIGLIIFSYIVLNQTLELSPINWSNLSNKTLR